MDKLERRKASDLGILDIDEKGIIRAYINKFNVVDLSKERSMPGSFRKTFNERLKKMWWLSNHDWDKSIGVTLALEEDNLGAIATGRINLNKQLGRDVFEDYKLFAEEGRTLQHSVRVIPVKYVIENEIMNVSEWKMTEWSSLTRPAAIEDTPTISIKHAEEELELTKKALELKYSDERLKQFETKIAELETFIKEAVLNTSRNDTTKSAIELINFINNVTI